MGKPVSKKRKKHNKLKSDLDNTSLNGKYFSLDSSATTHESVEHPKANYAKKTISSLFKSEPKKAENISHKIQIGKSPYKLCRANISSSTSIQRDLSRDQSPRRPAEKLYQDLYYDNFYRDHRRKLEAKKKKEAEEDKYRPPGRKSVYQRKDRRSFKQRSEDFLAQKEHRERIKVHQEKLQIEKELQNCTFQPNADRRTKKLYEATKQSNPESMKTVLENREMEIRQQIHSIQNKNNN